MQILFRCADLNSEHSPQMTCLLKLRANITSGKEGCRSKLSLLVFLQFDPGLQCSLTDETLEFTLHSSLQQLPRIKQRLTRSS